MLVRADRVFALGELIVKSASELKVPMICFVEEWVEAGALLSYAIDLKESYRRAAGYVDRILRGANPAELPIEQPTRLSLAVNLKTAKQLGITIPAAVRRIALYVDRLLKGADPATLPVERPTRVVLAINLSTFARRHAGDARIAGLCAGREPGSGATLERGRRGAARGARRPAGAHSGRCHRHMGNAAAVLLRADRVIQ